MDQGDIDFDGLSEVRFCISAVKLLYYTIKIYFRKQKFSCLLAMIQPCQPYHLH